MSIGDINNKNKDYVSKSLPFAEIDAVLYAPENTPFNGTDFTGFTGLGHLSTDGGSSSAAQDEGDTLYADGNTPVDEAQGEYNEVHSFTLIQYTDIDIVKLLRKDVLERPDGFGYNDGPKDLKRYAFLICRKQKGKRVVIYLPSASIRIAEDIEWNQDDLTGYGVEIKAFADSLGNTQYGYVLNESVDDGNVTIYAYSNNTSYGSVTPDGVQSVAIGTNQTFTAAPETGYTLKDWVVNGIYLDNTNLTMTIDDVQENYTVQAVFKAV
jgi:hypothetical protein